MLDPYSAFLCGHKHKLAYSSVFGRKCSKMGERRVIGVMSGSMSKACVTKHTETGIVGFY